MIELVPQAGIPLPQDENYMDLRARVEAACQTAELLEAEGLSVTPTTEDFERARDVAMKYAADPEQAASDMTNKATEEMTPASIQLVQSILHQFSREVATQAGEVRNLITNKLILETDNSDPRIRMKAYEMLGKITEVGLFTERSEVTVNHSSKEDIEQRLKGKLTKLVQNQAGEYVTPESSDEEDFARGVTVQAKDDGDRSEPGDTDTSND